MPAIIFSTRLNNFKPIHRGGIELYRYADRLRTLLNDKLGPSYSELLAVPSISEDAKHFHDNAHWRSDYVTNSQSLTLLSQEDQQNAAQRLQLYLDTINNLVSQLLADADAKNRELGDFLSQAVQIPSLDCVRVDNDRIVLVLWGFSSDESQKKNFRISKALDSYRIAAAAKAPVVSGLPQLKAETPATTQPQVTQKADSFETSDKRKVWWWMLGALLLLGLSLLIGWLLLHYGKGDGAAFIPDNPASVQPVDPGQTRPDPTDSLRRVRVMNRLLILLDKQQTMEMFAAELAKRYTPDQLRISHFNANVNLVQVTFEDANYSRWTRELTSIPGVVTIIPEYLASPVGATIPHDPNFSVTADCYHFKAIRAFEAWNLTMGNPGLIVAVVDGGLDVHHIELKGKIVHPFDIVPDKETIQLVPGQVHGTHVAGLAVGAANNGQGASGVAPNCQLMPIQISDANLKGSGLSTVNIIAGLSYAIKELKLSICL